MATTAPVLNCTEEIKSTSLEEMIGQKDLIHEIGSSDENPIMGTNEVTRKFRNQLEPQDLERVKTLAPELERKFVNDYNEIISFGKEVLDGVNAINARLLEEQDAKIPEADHIVNGILREIDGYSAKYSSTKARTFFDNLVKRFRGSTYNLKAMLRDAKPIAAKLQMAEAELLKMELELKTNVTRGMELRKETLYSISRMVTVIAFFEEILEVSRSRAKSMQDRLNLVKSDDEVIRWNERNYTIEEFRELLQTQTIAMGEIEKSWFSWRQKFFLYATNIVATRNIINVSIALQRTCHRVYTDAIPAARSQLVVWQQAEKARESARMANAANDGIDRLIAGAAEGAAAGVRESAHANQRTMLSDETILALTKGIQDQFKSLAEAEATGRKMRQRNLDIIRQSELAIRTAADESQRTIIANALAVVNSDAKALTTGQSDTQESLFTVSSHQ